VESRELRYFVAVAEELHFGKAAERLGMAQPPLSRAIAQLERQLGVTLLERTSRTVTLTEAGTALLAEGQAILTALTTAERRTRQAAAGQPGLVLAAKAGTSGELLTTLLDAYAAEPGAVPVGLLLCESQPQRTLPDGQADVALLHLPFDSTTGLDTETLHAERQVAILPAAHPLAGRPHLRMAEVTALLELPMARWPCPDGTYPEGPGPEVGSLTQLFQLIALGRTTAVIPESASADLRHDLAAVPVLDAAAVTTVIAWPEHSRSRAVAGLVRAATRLHQAADPLSTSLPGQFTGRRRVLRHEAGVRAEEAADRQADHHFLARGGGVQPLPLVAAVHPAGHSAAAGAGRRRAPCPAPDTHRRACGDNAFDQYARQVRQQDISNIKIARRESSQKPHHCAIRHAGHHIRETVPEPVFRIRRHPGCLAIQARERRPRT